jgi:hypothetical protein
MEYPQGANILSGACKPTLQSLGIWTRCGIQNPVVRHPEFTQRVLKSAPDGTGGGFVEFSQRRPLLGRRFSFLIKTKPQLRQAVMFILPPVKQGEYEELGGL